MIRLLLCDDNEDELRQLEALLCDRYGDGADVAAFARPVDALEHTQQGGVCDAAILDIVMPDMTGTELAAGLRGCGFSGSIIFLTTSREYAPESYEVGALDYLLKPIDAVRLDKVLDKLEARLRAEDNTGLLITVERNARRVLLRDILYAEAGDHVTHFDLENGDRLAVRSSLSAYAPALLADPRFAACHSSFIVNMDKIHMLDESDAVLKNGHRVPIARRYAAFRKQYMKWLMREGDR